MAAEKQGMSEENKELVSVDPELLCTNHLSINISENSVRGKGYD